MRSDLQGNRVLYHTRQRWRQAVVLSLLGLGLYGAPATQAEETPAEIFNRICASCHNSNPPPRAMHGEALRALPAEKVFFALDKGLMAMYVMSFNQERKKELAEFITGKPLSATAQGETPEELQRCAKSASLPADVLNHSHWSGWGIDLDNTRFQPAAQAKLDRAALSKLELRWAFAFHNAATLIPGILLVGSMDGFMRAYDPKTGEVIWKYDTKRNYDTVNKIPGNGGSLNGAGVTVVDGWLYFTSGYGFNGMPGNVLLAFGPPQGK